MAKPFFVHPTAEVAPDVVVGAGAKIWHGAQVLPGASVGEGTVVGKGVYVDFGVEVGSRVKIQNYALLYRGTVVEDNVFVGPQVVLANDKRPRATNPDGSPKTDADWILSGVTLRRGASIGAAAVILPGVEVGEHAMVGAGAVVASDVPAHALVVGNPAAKVGWVCVCGHQLDSGLLKCATCSRSYQRVDEGLALEERIEA